VHPGDDVSGGCSSPSFDEQSEVAKVREDKAFYLHCSSEGASKYLFAFLDIYATEHVMNIVLSFLF